MLLFNVDIGLHEMEIDDFTYIENFRYWDLREVNRYNALHSTDKETQVLKVKWLS